MSFLRDKQPCILKLLLLAATVSLFVSGTVVIGFPYLVRTVLGLSASHYGIAESVMGIASVLGSLMVVLLAQKLRSRHLSIVLVSFGICLVPCGTAFILPFEAFHRYLILLIMFFACQLGCSLFSTYAVSLIQKKTPATSRWVRSCPMYLHFPCVHNRQDSLFMALCLIDSQTVFIGS